MTSTPAPPAGRREVRDGTSYVVLRRTFHAPVEDVWAAVTEPERLARWIGTWTGDPASGEVAFRMLERDAVATALLALEDEPAVLSLGGGAVLDPTTEERLRGLDPTRVLVVFLEVGVADAARRVGLNSSRPLLIGNPRSQWIALMDQRRPVYQRVAALTVPTDGLTPDEVVGRVLAAVGDPT